MTSKPPPLFATGAEPPPMDRAITLALQHDLPGALRFSVGLVKHDLTVPGPLFVTGWLLSRMGKKAPAASALQTCAERAAASSNLPMAVAAFAELRELGEAPSGRIEQVAEIYAKGSEALTRAGAVPPKFAAASVKPLSSGVGGSALTEQAIRAVEYAAAALEADGTEIVAASPQRLFSSLGAVASAAMMRAFSVRLVDKGAILIEEGTTGTEAFLLARGEVEVTRGVEDSRILLARLGNGTLFGEMALLSRTPRAATVTAARPSIVLSASQETLGEVAADAPEVARAFADYCHRRMVSNLLRTSPILSALGADDRAALMERFVTRSFEEGEKLITQGSAAEGLHLLASGRVEIVRHDEGESVSIARLGIGEVVGEVAMVLRRPANADVVAEHPTVTLHLPAQEFQALIHDHPALLSKLYELAVKRDEETSSIVAQEAAEADDLII